MTQNRVTTIHFTDDDLPLEMRSRDGERVEIVDSGWVFTDELGFTVWYPPHRIALIEIIDDPDEVEG